jgi:diguanylate cyclase (GGDEF)-like protein/PAS domain S-box-containing protein
MNKSPLVQSFTRQCDKLPETATLEQAAMLVNESEQSVIAVIGNFGQLKGFVDQQDIIQLYTGNSQHSSQRLSQVIEHNTLTVSQVTISQNAPMTLAANLLAENRTCYLGVIDEDETLTGIVTAGDVLTSLHCLISQMIEEQNTDQYTSLEYKAGNNVENSVGNNAGNKAGENSPGKFEQLLRTVIDEIPNIVLMKDWNGRFLMVNRALANLYGTTPDKMIGKDDGAFNPNKEQVKFYLENVRGVMRSGKTQIVLEESTNAETGKIHYFQSIKKPLQDSNGQPCILVIANDVTDIRQSQTRVEESERSLKYAMEAIGEGLWDWDIRTGQVRHNKQWCKSLGFNEIKIRHPIEEFSALIYEDDLEKVNKALQEALTGVDKYSSQHRMIRKDGQIIWVLDRGRVVERDSEGQPLRMVGSFSDITERKKAEELRLTASVFTHSHDGIMICDAKQVILDVNPAFSKITGYSRKEVLGKKSCIMKSGIHDEHFYQSMWQKLSENDFWRGEIWNRNKQHELYAAETTISAINSPSGQLTNYISVFSDISLLKEQQKRLEMLAHYDALTQLPNRVLLAERIVKAQTQADRNKTLLAVCYLDLDGFKPINDQYGHNIGDDLLIEVAGRLEDTIRSEDTAARLGGDEFVLLLNNIETVEECTQAAGRILTALSCPIPINNHEVKISASMGIVLYPSINVDADTLLRHADQAMYQAKLSGRNRFHLYDSRHDEQVQVQHEIIEDIQRAFLNGEFQLFYQPKVNIREGKEVGFEALIRWHHPQRGIIFPGEFLPVLEGHPLAIQVDLWVLEEVMRQLSEWKKMGIHQQVSINLTGDTLLSHTFIHDVEQLMSEYPALSATSIEFEVLETAALEDMHQTSQIFKQCQALGFSIALDDFGTGYSSLTYFRRLPTDTLKIDQSFVRNMLNDSEDLAIVKSVIGLTRAYDRKVIAEGVENTEIAIALLDIGCDIVQGYGIAHPMSAEQIPEWLENFKPPIKGVRVN